MWLTGTPLANDMQQPNRLSRIKTRLRKGSPWRSFFRAGEKQTLLTTIAGTNAIETKQYPIQRAR